MHLIQVAHHAAPLVAQGHHLAHQWWSSVQPNSNYLPDLRDQVRTCLCIGWTWRF